MTTKKINLDGEFIPVERPILAGTHPALVGLGLEAQGLYCRLIDLSYELRRVCLPESYCVIANLSRRLGCDPRTVRSILAKLKRTGCVDTGDILQDPCRYAFVVIVGLDVKLSHHGWKDQTPGTEREKEKKERIKNMAAPPPEIPKSTPTQRSMELQLKAIVSAWTRRFVPARALTYAEAGKIRAECKRKNVSPVWFIDQLRQDHPAPWKLACLFFAGQPGLAFPEMTDGERERHSWRAWDNSFGQ